MLETLFLIVTAGIAGAAIMMYYKTLENSSQIDRNFRNDGQLHLIYPN